MSNVRKNVSSNKKSNSALPLIIDSRSFYHKQLQDEDGIFADTTQKALQSIENENEEISAIFMTVHPDSLKLIKSTHQHRPNTPLFLFYDDELPFSNEELNRLAIEKAFNEKTDHNLIIEQIKLKSIPKLPEKRYNEKQAESKSTTASSSGYQAVKIENFLLSCRSFFDVFVKIDEKKYVKILNAMDTMTQERTQSYIDKGITHFYISKKNYRACLNYCDTFSYTLLNRKDVSFGFKTSVTLCTAQDVFNLIKADGMKEEFFEPLENFLIMLNQLLGGVDLSHEKLFQSFLSNIMLFEKAVSTATVASLLIKPLQITSSHAYHQLGYAALLHDISLIKMSPAIQTEDISKMNPTEQKLYFKHPELSAKELEKFKIFDEATLQAVAQHHERKNKLGFPQKVLPDRIHRLAEVIGICDEFVNLLYAETKYDWDTIKEKMKTEIFPGFSAEIIQAFTETFFTRKKEYKVKP